ncbi:MAG: cytidylyltransferase domain-containing protein [Atribacterota bacterium]
MKPGVIIQARTSSTRLPGKILKKLPYNKDITVLEQVVRRVKKAKNIETIVVATTEDKSDDKIIEVLEDYDVKIFRGSMEDVLARYYNSAKKHNINPVVRITSDCPCIDWNILDKIINIYKESDYEYVSNTINRTYPHGLDAEVFSFEVLGKVYNKAKRDEFREHVTAYILSSNEFNIKNISAPQNLKFPDIRITLDTEQDYALLCAVYGFLYKKKKYFDTTDIINLFKQKPWLKLINKNVKQKKIYDSVEEEIQEAIELLDLQDLNRAKKYIEDNML